MVQHLYLLRDRLTDRNYILLDIKWSVYAVGELHTNRLAHRVPWAVYLVIQ